jgi:predicted amidohydrolase YtcJ
MWNGGLRWGICRGATAWALLVFAALPLIAQAPHKQVAADLMITNARVYTGNARQQWAEAVAVHDGRIIAVGSAREVGRSRAPSTRVIDAQHHLVLPGFTDSHIHFYEGSLALTRLRLEDCNTVPEMQAALKKFAAEHAHQPWILGRGWSYPAFGPAAMPHKKFLDEIVADRPVFLVGFDGHSYWANSKALAIAGVTRDTPDPANGTVVRDENGEPTGALKEDPAADLVRRVIPQPTREQKLEALRRGLAEANRAGLVRVYGAGGVGESSDFGVLDLLDEIRRAGQLTVRFDVAQYLDPAAPVDEALEQVETACKTHNDEWIATRSVKVYLDGVVEAHTAAMLEPYSDEPKQQGKLFWDADKYNSAVALFHQHGFDVLTHAIGDRAVRLALNSYENAVRSDTSNAPLRVEHIETITREDIPRFGRLGVIASFQPLHAYPDEDKLTVWARNAGPDRASRAWAWQSIASAGGRLAFGSDWPVVTLNPWEGLQNAVTRQTWEGTPQGGWLPAERVSLEQAIEAYTRGAAVAGAREKDEGSLEPGKLADVIIVSQDLFKVDANRIRQTEVLLTMVGGKVVYESPAWQARSKSRQEKQ